jgi:hypothetical protein
MPAATSPAIHALTRTWIVSAQAGQYRQQLPGQQHLLAPVPVTDSAEPQHRDRQPERVGDNDQLSWVWEA